MLFAILLHHIVYSLFHLLVSRYNLVELILFLTTPGQVSKLLFYIIGKSLIEQFSERCHICE